jgi:hypothetical protein
LSWQGGAAHRLVGLDHRRHRPVRHDEGQPLFQTAQPLNGVLDRIDALLKDDLLSGMRLFGPG